jgi:hypothetical protein
MATKYFLEYKNKIVRNIGRTDSDTEKKIIDAFNDAMDIFSTVAEINSLNTITTVDLEEDVYIYELQALDLTDLKHIYSIVLADSTRYYPPMDYITKNTWDAEIKPFIHSLTGKPVTFSFFDDTLYFAGVPDSSDYHIDISCSYWPSKVLNDFSEVDLTSFDAALIALATAKVWLKLEEVELHDSWIASANADMKLYDRDLKHVVDFKGKSASRRSTTMGRSPNYWADPFRRKM